MTAMQADFAAPARSAWRTRRWLLLRRASQFAILALFLAGPWFGLWIVKGNLNYSYTLDTLPLTDPYVLLQSLLAGHLPETRAVVGAAIVVVLYLLVGGRSYCAWVCPLNPVTDLAAWLRRRLGIRGGIHVSRQARFGILGATLLASIGGGGIAWEFVNPVSLLHRGLFFGIGLAWIAVLAVFLFDLVVAQRGWCGHLCPVGAFYSLLGRLRPLRVAAARRERCDDCNDCFAVCPEPLVIRAPLKGGPQGIGPAITSAQCTNCGRCIDVCSKDVFRFQLTHRLSSAGSSS
ncbi:MAG TPA: quinol dehydrogenase ferredoxin subunit NapH [Rhodocyclaceae bacterium]